MVLSASLSPGSINRISSIQQTLPRFACGSMAEDTFSKSPVATAAKPAFTGAASASSAWVRFSATTPSHFSTAADLATQASNVFIRTFDASLDADSQRYLTEVATAPEILGNIGARQWNDTKPLLANNFVMTGEGSSFNAIEMARPLMAEALQTVPSSVQTSTASAFQPGHLFPYPVVAVSQSGSTTDLRKILDQTAVKQHRKNIALTNVPASPMGCGDYGKYHPLLAGLEQSIPASKSVVATVAELDGLALEKARKAEIGHSPTLYTDNVKEQYQQIANYLSSQLWSPDTLNKMAAFAKAFNNTHTRTFDVFADGTVGLANEIKLKLMETAQLRPLFSFNSVFGNQHGPKAAYTNEAGKLDVNLITLLPIANSEQSQQMIQRLESMFGEQSNQIQPDPQHLFFVYMGNQKPTYLSEFQSKYNIPEDNLLQLPAATNMAPGKRLQLYSYLQTFQILSAYITALQHKPINNPLLMKAVVS